MAGPAGPAAATGPAGSTGDPVIVSDLETARKRRGRRRKRGDGLVEEEPENRQGRHTAVRQGPSPTSDSWGARQAKAYR
jgi:hypothetical protein